MFIMIFAGIIGFFMAFSIGANDVANAMATAVGSKAITPRQAAIIASFAEFLGAVLFGTAVTKTIASGIVNIEAIGEPTLIMYGALSALIAATAWVMVATVFGMPVSTTHSIIGGMIGFGLVSGGIHIIYWSRLAQIVLSWFLSPFLGGLISFFVFKSIVHSILHRNNPVKCARLVSPIAVGVTFFVIIYMFFLKNVETAHITSLSSGIIAGILGFLISRPLITRFIAKNDNSQYDVVETIFRKVQVLTSIYVSFSHGANDVANAVGPLALIYIILQTGALSTGAELPPYILMIGGLGIAVGIATYGYKVMNTVGYQITELNNTRGFSIDFSTATTVLLASVLGLPISTTHTVVGSVTGVGMARGFEVVNFSIIKSIIYSWFITVPFAAGVAALAYILLTHFF